jgi:hypothetical protein
MSGAWGMAAIGALVIGGGYALTKKNPYSAKDVGGAVGINSPLSPRSPPVMPDLTQQTQLQTLQESKDAALRYGRAATILTGGGAGGSPGSDKLGP